MTLMEFLVDGTHEKNEYLYFSTDFDSVDSIRLTSFILKTLLENLSTSSANIFIARIRESKSCFSASSPYFYSSELKDFLVPISIKALYAFEETTNLGFLKESKDKSTKKLKYIPLRYLKNIQNINEVLRDYNGDEKKYLERVISENSNLRTSDFIIKNRIERITLKSESVYPIRIDFVKKFRFLLTLSELDKVESIGEILNKMKHISLGKRKTIGYGLARIEVIGKDYSLKNELESFQNMKNEGYYYIMNKIPITEKILSKIDLDKSFYEIVKVSGFYEQSKYGELIGRFFYCFREGSILYFKKLDSIYEISDFLELERGETKKYFLPIFPIRIPLKVN